MLVILCIIFGINSEYFFQFRNIMNIGTYASIMGTMAAGLTVAMLLGGLDVSQYSFAALAGMIMGLLIEKNVPIPVTLFITLMAGVAGGCINANRVKFISHIIAGVTAVMGGIITVCQTSSAMPNHGYGNDMDGIAAVILGGIGLAGGKGKVGGTLIGILVLAVLVNGMTLLNIQSYWQQVVKGCVLIFAVFIDALRSAKSRA